MTATITAIEQRLAENLIAEGAGTAACRLGTCPLCRRPVRRGERYALLTASGRAAHVTCTGTAAPPRALRSPSPSPGCPAVMPGRRWRNAAPRGARRRRRSSRAADGGG